MNQAATMNADFRPLRRYLAFATVRRMARRIGTPRRLGWTALAGALAILWLGQTLASILFRAPANAESLKIWIPCGLAAYAVWSLVKTACQSPVEPFEWTPTERELLIGAPLTRSQLIRFRLGSVVAAAAVKATCFAAVMLPDVRYWPLAFAGMLLALVWLDILRMGVEIIIWNVSPRQRNWIRTAFISWVGAAGVSALAIATWSPTSASAVSWPPPFDFILSIGHGLLDLRTTWPGRWVMGPFPLAGQIILENTSFAAGCLRLLGLCGTTCGAGFALHWLDRYFEQARQQRESARFAKLLSNQPEIANSPTSTDRSLHIPRRSFGVGTLLWRQSLGMWHYRYTLALSFALPAILSLLPLLSNAGAFDRAMHIAGSLVFFTFLLLPSALRFDFRRDIERIALLKALPSSPWVIVVGQLAAPVLATTVFQAAVLCIAMACRPFHPGILMVTLAALVPVNILIFSFENVVYLLYPYRLSQEGIGVFVRSILNFTGKGVVFGLGLAANLGLAVFSAQLANQIPFGTHGQRFSIIFSILLVASLSVAATVTTWMLARVFRRFDPSQDMPATS